MSDPRGRLPRYVDFAQRHRAHRRRPRRAREISPSTEAVGGTSYSRSRRSSRLKSTRSPPMKPRLPSWGARRPTHWHWCGTTGGRAVQLRGFGLAKLHGQPGARQLPVAHDRCGRARRRASARIRRMIFADTARKWARSCQSTTTRCPYHSHGQLAYRAVVSDFGPGLGLRFLEVPHD